MSEARFSENAEADLLVLENELRPFSNLEPNNVFANPRYLCQCT
jgi:hypothetical protein